MVESSPSLAVFVSAHGFGHAARACAVMAALRHHLPTLSFEIFSSVPEWFFSESVDGPIAYHEVTTDVGLVQTTSLTEDIDATARRLDELYPPSAAVADSLAANVRHAGCCAVLCDISPLGLVVARRAGLPGILLESFTWDFIYQAYLETCPRLQPHVTWLAQTFAAADLHIQCQPVCRPALRTATVGPIARPPRRLRAATRRRLEVPDGSAMALVTMGGVPWDYRWLDRLAAHPRAFFVVPGSAARTRRVGSLLMTPHRSGLYHPDLAAAADVVVAKLGYSTVAEVHNGAARMLFIPRTRFPESPILARWAERQLGATAVTEERFSSGAWLDDLETVLESDIPPARPPATGATEAANLIAAGLPAPA